jgi:hypothetical protein
MKSYCCAAAVLLLDLLLLRCVIFLVIITSGVMHDDALLKGAEQAFVATLGFLAGEDTSCW